ncbi:MAG: OB-fold domain-containing protein [Dehalococcoidia bacterium]
MPKMSPGPDEVSKPFWDACNKERLVVQNCTACTRLQHPPQEECYQCGSKDNLEWREMNGRGKIHGYCIMSDSRIKLLQADQPFIIAVIELEDAPEIKMFSHLPGTPVDDNVPVGANVQVEFQETEGTDQKVAEWRVTN